MPLQNLEKNNYLYNKGLFTESSALNRPDGTSIDEEDFIINRDGSRKRRYGWKRLDSGNSKVNDTIGYTQYSYIDVAYWENAGGVLTYPIVVLRINQYLYFFSDEGDKLDPFPTTERINLLDYRYDGHGITPSGNYGSVEFTSGGSRLFVTGENMTPIYLDYVSFTFATVTKYYIIAKQIHVMERDTEGLADGFGPATEPVVDDVIHRYNLYNQGWDATNISTYFTTHSRYPSNSQQWIYGMFTDPATGKEAFDAAELANQDFGSTYAPKGRHIQSINVHNWSTDFDNTYRLSTAVYVPGAPNRVRITHIDSVTHLVNDKVYIRNLHMAYKDTAGRLRTKTISGSFDITVVHATSDFSIDYTFNEYASDYVSLADYTATVSTNLIFRLTVPYGFQGLTKGFRAIAYHEGRIFLAGIDDPYRNIYSKRIYYSSLRQEDQDFSQYYSSNDPTSEKASDPLETDGGFIYIPDIGIIRKLISFGPSLLIFADNGIWAVLAGADTGYFTSINYTVSRISDVGIVTKNSVIEANGSIFFWGQGGIYVVEADNVTQRPKITNISDPTIKTFMLDEIDYASGIQASYDKKNNVLYWLYSDGTQTESYRLNKILVLDLVIGAFYKWSAPLSYESSTQFSYPLALAYSRPDDSISASANAKDPTRRMRLLKADRDAGVVAENISWYEMTKDTVETGVLDFVDYSPVSRFNVEALPYLETTYEYGEGPTRKKWCTGVTCFFKRTEDRAYITSGGVSLLDPSGCLMRAKWEFADSDVANKWSPQQQVYRLQRFYYPTTTYAGSPITEDWDNGYPIVKTRNKIRGNGSVLNLRFDAEATKHCNLIGWHLDMLESRATE